MTFWDDVKKIGRNIADKGKDVVEITKLHAQIAAEKDKIRELYAKIGEQVYNSYISGESSEHEELCAQIKEINAKINELSAKVLELKNATRCPSCGAELAKDVIYCSKCGTKIK